MRDDFDPKIDGWTPEADAELLRLWRTSATACAYVRHADRHHARALWASGKFAEAWPACKSLAAYKRLERIL